MVCIYCEGKTRVFNSRHQKKRNSIWRRRECINCKAVFTSIEGVDLEKSLVVSKNKRLEPFLRDRLFASVYDSLKHRKTALNDATALTDTIISKLLHQTQSGEVNRDTIVTICIQVIRRFDKTASVYYAAYHPLTVT